eukprot:COSAG05_NODE_2007_length_3714_cov_6.483084_5_plen_106_part_00
MYVRVMQSLKPLAYDYAYAFAYAYDDGHYVDRYGYTRQNGSGQENTAVCISFAGYILSASSFVSGLFTDFHMSDVGLAMSDTTAVDTHRLAAFGEVQSVYIASVI